MTTPNNTVASLPAKLLPCPFCGNDVQDDEGCFPAGRGNTHFIIRCGNPGCNAEVSMPSRADTIAAWNRRASPAPSAGVGVALLEAARREFRDSDAAGDVLDWLTERALQHPAAPSVLPEGVYYSSEHDNFYRRIDGAGMGTPFYNKWRPVAADFPQA